MMIIDLAMSKCVYCVSVTILYLEYRDGAMIFVYCVIGVTWDRFDIAKTNSIALLVWRLVANPVPPGDRYPKQWQWPLDVHGAWR